MAKVIRYSHVGNGNSTHTGQFFSAEQGAEHTKKLLDALYIKQPIIHVSHSYAGIIARAFPFNYPEAIKSLLLIESSSKTELDIMRETNLKKR